MLKIALTLTNIALFATALFMGYTLYRNQGSGEQMPSEAHSSEVANPLPASTVKPEVGIKPVIDRNLFKAIPIKTDIKTAAVENQKPPEATKLNVKLWGTMVQNSGEPLAVIEDGKERKQYLFRIGDMVQDAEIKEILREKVLLNVQGRNEFLQIEQARGGSVSAKTAASASTGQNPEPSGGSSSASSSAFNTPPGSGYAGKVPTLVPRIRGSSPGQKSNSPFPGSTPRSRAMQSGRSIDRPGDAKLNSDTP